MKPSLQELHQSGHYQLVLSFKIDETMQFLLGQLKPETAGQPTEGQARLGQRRPVNRRAMALILPISLGIGWLVGTGLASWLSADKLVSGGLQLLMGFLAFFPLISVHEFIHGVFFRQIGAPKVGYGWSWKSMMAYAYAQNYVMNLRELAYVAAMPFLFITPALGLAWLIWPQFALVWGMLLFLHTIGCLGDFALINFWRNNQHRLLYTYDDVEQEGRTYYFEQTSPAPSPAPPADVRAVL